jgi:methionyl aminopeptidase
MISIKSQREIELMKEAGRIVALTLRVLGQAIKPGISTYDLDKIAEETIREQGAVPSFKGYRGYPGSICASVNNVVIHGIPDKKTILKNGDIISIDIGAWYKGYHGDSARTLRSGKSAKPGRGS